MSTNRPSRKKNTKRNLIVNYIPSNFKVEELHDLFSTVGAIKSVRVMQNADGTGKGFGFVEYHEHQAAEAAIQQLDGMAVGKKKLKVAYARPGGSREGCNLFVKNLPCTWTTEKLAAEFGKFGELLESRVLSTKDSQSRRCGFVRFDLPRDAQAAIHGMHGKIPEDGKFQITVSPASKRVRNQYHSRNKSDFEYHPQQLPEHRMHNYQSGNFSNQGSTMESQLRAGTHRQNIFPPEYFLQHQASYSSPNSLSYNSSPTQKHRALGSQRKDPSQLVDQGNDEPQDFTSNEANKIMLANLPVFLEELHLEHICRKYGEIAKVTIQRDNNGNSLGCAEITFVDFQSKLAALKGLDGCAMCDKTVVCY